MRRRARAAIGLALASVSAVAACTIVNGLEVQSPAGADASSDAADEVDSNVCPHALPPPKPSATGPGGSEIFVTALVSFDLGNRDGGDPVIYGFDLDNTCSCQGQPESCKSSGGKQCDLEGGLDDNGAGLAQLIQTLGGPDLSAEGAQNFKSGARGILMWVAGYNGLPDDDSVQVSLLVSPGTDDGGAPSFDGGDSWAVTDDQVTGGRGTLVPKTYSTGYVANGTLVVQGTFDVDLVAGGRLSLAGYVSGTIAKRDGSFYLSRGVVAGRSSIATTIRVIGGITKDGKKLCDPGSEKLFATLKSGVCGRADIMADPAGDGKDRACDGLSLGMGFVGAPAQFGSVRPQDSTPYCADADLSCPPSN